MSGARVIRHTAHGYPKPVGFLIPSVVLLGSAGPGALATERFEHTVRVAVFVGVVAVTQTRYGNRRTKEESG